MGKILIFQKDKLGTAREEQENYPACVEDLTCKNYLSGGKCLPLSAILLNVRHKITHPDSVAKRNEIITTGLFKWNIRYSPSLRKFIFLNIRCVNHSFFSFPLKTGRFSNDNTFISSFAVPISNSLLLEGGSKARSNTMLCLVLQLLRSLAAQSLLLLNGQIQGKMLTTEDTA